MKQGDLVDLTIISDCDSENEDIYSRSNEVTLLKLGGIAFTERLKRMLLDPFEWFNDDIISLFTHRLMERYPHIHCCSTFFYDKVSSIPLDTMWLERWRRNITLEKRVIMIPVNWNNSHWALVSVDINNRCISYYDSMMISMRSKEALSFIKSAMEVSGILSKTKSPPSRRCDDAVGVMAFVMSRLSIQDKKSLSSDIGEIKLVSPVGQQQQTDGSSCGVFTCWNMEQVAQDKKPSSSSLDPVKYRKCILKVIQTGIK